MLFKCYDNVDLPEPLGPIIKIDFIFYYKDKMNTIL